VEGDILERVLGKIYLRPADPPNIQDMPARHLEGRGMRCRVEIFSGTSMPANHSRQFFSEFETYSVSFKPTSC
jgi:hypothetical protein